MKIGAMEDKSSIGITLKELRKKIGMTQSELARRSGVDRAYISQLESGKTYSATLGIAQKLARGLDISTSALLGEKEESLGNLLSRAQAISRRMDDIEFIPVIGYIPAGYPELVDEEAASDYVPVPKELLKNASKRVYALRVSGESLKGDGIENGDIIIVDKDSEMFEGKIYAVRTAHNEVTAKHLYLNNGQIILRSSNGDYKDLVMTNADILGRVIASIKRF
ncbi:hypothetical protein DA01_03625 [Dehalococcoides mccartyi]|uniref:HTH cro/C1-type domain-containing protein n=2 Tax=Dehalococcoides mccartyi TaxID=61435 RepID=A0A0V8LXT6_9CHLR|nr:XRE family transcriptional regulator [Dehalococcoides mccartyi]KSV16333.1 hypothetical protein DA01_03625 [Dehalococcoides mccartyi]